MNDTPNASADLAAQRKGHIESHYLATAGALPLFAPLRGKHTADVCVVGGGLAGLWTALELAHGGLSVALVEANRIGFGASGRNGGFVSAGFAESIFEIEDKLGAEPARQMYRLSAEAVGRIRALLRERGREDIILGHGWLKLIRHGDVHGLERRAERMARDYGQNYRLLRRDELPAYVSSDRYHGAILDPAPFHIHPLNFCALMADLVVEAGVAVFENSRARFITKAKRGYAVRTVRGSIEAQQVVLATSALGGPSNRLNRAVIPVSTYMVSAKSTHLDRAIHFRGCIGDTRRASDYYRVVGSGESQRLLWGGRITTRVSRPLFLGRKLRADILEVYPQLFDLEIERAWSGLMGYAVHKMPIIGRIGAGIWAVTAFGGHGLNTTAMAGQLVGRAITRGEDEWKLFAPYGAGWGGGWLGRMAVQMEYWRLRLADRFEESRAGN